VADRSGRGQVAICAARFYPDLADRLVAGAQRVLADAGYEHATFDVPGAFELPLAAQWCAESGRFVAVVCLGVVIRGETDHYDFVCQEAARGIGAVQRATGVPCGFGVITCANREQALARAGEGRRHVGEDAARAVVAMLDLRARLAPAGAVR